VRLPHHDAQLPGCGTDWRVIDRNRQLFGTPIDWGGRNTVPDRCGATDLVYVPAVYREQV